MGRNALAIEGRADVRPQRHMLAHDVLNGVAAEPIAAVAHKQRLGIGAGALLEPVAKNSYSSRRRSSGLTFSLGCAAVAAPASVRCSMNRPRQNLA